MSHTIILIPTETNVGLTSVRLGIAHAIERRGIRLSIFNPITQNQTTTVVHKNSNLLASEPLETSYVEFLLSKNKKDALMEKIIANYYANLKNAEVVLIEGLVSTYKYQITQFLNLEIAKMLNAEIVFIISQDSDTLEQLKRRIELTRSNFSSTKSSNIAGVIINKINAPIDKQSLICSNLFENFKNLEDFLIRAVNIDMTKLQDFSPLPVLGAIPWNSDLNSARAIDIAHCLNAIVINEGDINTRRVSSITFCMSITHMLERFHAGSLLVISSDRHDILVAACLMAMNGVEISAILLTDGYETDICIGKLCEKAFATGLPVFTVNTNIWQTLISLRNLRLEIPINDNERIEKTKEYIANYINIDWIKSLATISKHRPLLSPPAFRYRLTELARKAKKRIVLPEGSEPRTVKAATICAEHGIATCILLGDSDEINRVATSQGIKLSADIEIIDPKIVRERYVSRLVTLRKNKGMTEVNALEQLKDNVMLGTLMLEQDEVDGLVSGAIHTTANTTRPALQLIKTASGNSLVSSVFFMLLPEQVYVYGDCAINPNPTAEQLSEIAIQSADSAVIFGIEPRVAMLSYSTGISGAGSDVEKVREATRIAQKKRPDLIIDGPLQYDAAVVSDVAKSKAPNSPVAGSATVFIFPDLNAGNITYKAVQRSAELVSIGPMLQGMRKPVNDLSRGALIDDIVYTIALTAIQSSQK